MKGPSARWHRRRFRRRIRRANRGVVSVVGTLLALLVFFALFGIFLTQYLPLWMTEDEQQLAIQTQESIAELKSKVDLQVALGSPPVYSTPFTTVSQSIPLLTQPTTATMQFVPSTAGVYAGVVMNPGPGNSAAYTQNVSLGRFTIQLPNRYYAPQLFSLEGDAVVQSQGSNQQVLDYPPILAVNQSGSAFGVTVSIVQLVGTSAASVASGTQQVYSHYVFTQTILSTNTPTKQLNVNYTIGTLFPCAWYSFLSTSLSNANMTKSSLGSSPTAHYFVYPATPPSCKAGVGGPFPVRVWFGNIASFTLIFSEIQIVVGVGVE